MMKSFGKLMIDSITQFPKLRERQARCTPKIYTSHIIFTLQNDVKKKILKEPEKNKKHLTYRGRIRIIGDFSSENMQARRDLSGIFDMFKKKKKYQPSGSSDIIILKWERNKDFFKKKKWGNVSPVNLLIRKVKRSLWKRKKMMQATFRSMHRKEEH